MTRSATLVVPPGWFITRAQDDPAAIGDFLDQIPWSDDQGRDQFRTYLDELGAVLRASGVDALAATAVPDGDAGLVQAACAVTSVPYDGSDPGALAALVATSPFGDGEVEVVAHRTSLGMGARASRYRPGRELTDRTGHWPYVREVRYALPVAEGVAVLLHCETLSVVYAEELDGVFDAIAARVTVDDVP